MADERIGINVDLDSNTKGLDKAISALEGMGDQAAQLAKGFRNVSRQAENMAKNIAKADAQKLERVAAATERINKAQAKSRGTNPAILTGTDVGSANKINDYYTKQRVLANIAANREAVKSAEFNKLGKMSASQWTEEVDRLAAKYGEVEGRARAAAVIARKAAEMRAGGGATGTGAGSANDVATRMGLSNGPLGMMNTGIMAQMADYRKNLDATLEPQRRLVAHLQEEEAATNRLTNARYAMFAAGATLAAGSFALGAAMIGMVKAAMDYETALAQISRTSGMTGASLQQFNGDLRDLASTIPIAFADISEIATLGGQLNISQENLAGFTESVAQFGMTTNVQAGTAAEAFGRLNGLLPDVNDNYDALGSSILNVGVNSVATESDIIGTATQIAAVGSQAGFSADEVIGFAAAMRSVGINPYLSRGGLTRIFGVISDAIANGGAQLEEFASLSGRSAQQFESSWRDSAATTFIDLLRGMENARAGGEDLYQTMNRLGVVNSQDRQVLAVLSQNYDELTSAIGYANDGFTEGTQLQAAFDVQAGTLASRLQMLMNSLHALFGVIAGPALAIWGPLVFGATEFAKALADIIDNSAMLKGVLAVVGGITTVAAGLGIAGGAMTLFTAALIAGRTAVRVLNTEMQMAKLAMMEKAVADAQGTASLSANTAGVVRNTVAQTGLARALSVTAQREREAAAATAAFTAATGSGAISNMTALRQVLIGGADGGNKFSNAIRNSIGAIGAWGAGIAVGMIALEALKAGIQDTWATTEQYTAALNESATATRLFTLANQGINLVPFDVNKLAEIPRYLDLIAERSRNAFAGLDPTRYFELDNSGFTSALRDIEQGMLALGDTTAQRQAFIGFAESLDLSEQEMRNLLTAMPALRDAMISGAEGTGELTAGIDGVISEGDLFNLILDNMENGISTVAGEAMVGSEAMYYLADSASEAGGELQSVADALASDFAMPTMLGELGSAMRDFAMGIAEGGMIFSAVAAEGQVNVANFQAMVGAAIVAGQSQGLSAADSVNQLFAALKQNGYDVMAILQALQNQGMRQGFAGLSMAQLRSSAMGARSEVSNLSTYMSTVFKNAQARAAASTARTARSIGGGGGGGGGRGARKSPRSLAGAAQSAAVEIRNLVDYTNDLRKVMDRAFEIRFGSAQAMDKISEGWAEIAERIADAQKAMADANNEIAETQAKMAELTADQNIKRYFLSIAEAYDDTLRADELRADIAGLDADLAKSASDLAEAQKDRATAQEEMAMGLTGDSQAARENRANVLGLAESYQSYLLALASSGTSQAELQATAARLKSQFMEQGIAAGFSAQELDTYSKAFDDLGTIIARVPYNVNVAFNADPALQALAEFDAAAAAAAERAGRNAGQAYSGGFGGGIGGLGGIGGGLPGLDIPFPEMPELPDFGTKKLPKTNDGTRIVPLRGAPEIYDPTEETNFIGGEGSGEEQAESWWDGFWRELTTSHHRGSGGTANIGLGIANALGGGMSTGVRRNVERTTKQMNSDLLFKGQWNATGTQTGEKIASGQKAGFVKGAVATMMLQNLSQAQWGGRGDDTGAKFAGGQKIGFERSGPGSVMLASLGTKNWSGGGRTSGHQFGSGVKGGFDSANPVGSMTGSVSGPNWAYRGREAGNQVGWAVKSGFDDTGVAGKLQSAVKDANWHGHGKNIGYRIADGIKAGFNEAKPSVSPANGPSTPIKMYREGGYTGGGNPNSIAGMVHKREFVMPADATRNIGLPVLEHMKNTGSVPMGGFSNGMTVIAELSPVDRQLLAAAGNVNLTLTGGQIASVTGAANLTAARRGGN